jgi:hypothetical protein
MGVFIVVYHTFAGVLARGRREGVRFSLRELLFIFFATSMAFSASAMADGLAGMLPQLPRAVDGAGVREVRPESGEVWYRKERFIPHPSTKDETVLHGVHIEHRALPGGKDAQSDYIAVHSCFYEGEAGPHRIVVTHERGRMTRAEYFLGEACALTRKFDEYGREIPEPAGARGAKHKRQQVLRRFDDVYGTLNPEP